MNIFSLIWNPLGGWWWTAVLSLGLAASMLSSWHSSRLLVFPKRMMLLLLRSLMVIAVVILIARPALERARGERLPSAVAVMVDESASMALPAAGKTRLALVQEALKKSQAHLSELGHEHRLDWFAFSNDARPTSLEGILQQRAEKLETDLAVSLEAMRRTYDGGAQVLSGIVLFSDGADRGSLRARSGRLLDEALSGIPIYVFQPGDDDEIRDARVSALRVNDFAFVKTPLEVQVDVELQGLSPKRVPVSLYNGAELLATATADFNDGRTLSTVKIVVTPQKLGSQIFTVKIPNLADDSIPENNQRSFIVRVIRDKIRVLHVAGHPSWDVKFLRLALKSDPNVDLIAFYILRTKEDVLYDIEQNELSLIPFPHQELFGKDLASFDLVIFQDFDNRKFFPVVYLENLRQYVEKGGAFMMLGGPQSFAGGDYGRTPLGEVLPLAVPGAATPFADVSAKVSLTAAGLRHPLTRLHPDASLNARLWQSLAPFRGLNAVGEAAAGAVVLAQADNRPFLAVREVGKGRTMALTSNSIWTLDFLQVRDGGTSEAYMSLIKNSIRWLIGDPTEALLDIDVGGAAHRLGEGVEITLRSRTRSYDVNARAKAMFEVTEVPGGKVTLTRQGRTDELGRLAAEIKPSAAGFFRVRGEALLPDGSKAAADNVFAVEGPQGEWSDPHLNSPLLKRLAEESGGKWTKLPHVIDPAIKAKTALRITERESIPLWNTLAMLLVVSAAFFAEWALRRHWGLA